MSARAGRSPCRLSALRFLRSADTLNLTSPASAPRSLMTVLAVLVSNKKKLGIILQQLAYRASCRELRGPRPVLHRLRPGSLPGRWRVTWLRRTNRVATSMFTWPSGCETTSKVIFGESGLGGAGLGEIVQCLRAVLECSGSCILANVQDLLYTRARTSRLRRRKQRRCYGFKIDRRACDRKTLQPLKLLKDPTSASQLVWILYALILISN